MRSEGQHLLGMKQRATFAGREPGSIKKQPRQLQIALALLFVALFFILVKERDFWLGSDDGIESDATNSQSTPQDGTRVAPVSLNQAAESRKTSQASESAKVSSASPKTTPAPKAMAAPERVAPEKHSLAKNAVAATNQALPRDPSGRQTWAQENTPPSHEHVSASKRAVLPPLTVDVVAGEAHSSVHPASDASKVPIPGGAKPISTVTTSIASLATDAAERERLSPQSAPELRQAVDPTYPLLGQHVQVQGSVVLQAVVGADGIIENLRVLSGPAILAAAAQQAVRQWRFKPYLQNGQPVETKATITVNFSIRVSDNAAKAS